MKVMYILMIMAMVSASAETVYMPKYDDACLSRALEKCGKSKIDHRPPFSEEERKILMCRLDAMVSCQDGMQEVKIK